MVEIRYSIFDSSLRNKTAGLPQILQVFEAFAFECRSLMEGSDKISISSSTGAIHTCLIVYFCENKNGNGG
jgi:hypothetical protein